MYNTPFDLYEITHFYPNTIQEITRDNRVNYQAGSGIELRQGTFNLIWSSLFYNGVLGTVSEIIKRRSAHK